MSLPRFAAWGGAGGLLLSVLLAAALGWDAFLVLGPIFALSGAACAAGSLALARRGDDRELFDASAEVTEVGLTEDEAQELLGGKG